MAVRIISIDFAEGQPSPKSLITGTSVIYIETENLSYFDAIKPHKNLKMDYIQMNQLPVTMGWY